MHTRKRPAKEISSLKILKNVFIATPVGKRSSGGNDKKRGE